LSDTLTDDELAALVHRITEAAEALIRGDIEGYAARIKHADDYTLMSPYGGDPCGGFDDSDAAFDALARFFRGGEANVEVVETYASGDYSNRRPLSMKKGRASSWLVVASSS
jgi:ketosteroid isomerase-like protein